MAYFFIVRMARGSVILALSLVAISCSSLVKVRDTSIPELLAPVASSDVAGLLNRVEPFTSIQALRASRVLIQFIDVESKDKYRTADAILAVQRPDKIRLVVQIPVTGTRIAEMVSESNRFRVAIYLDAYKRFLTGTNNADYSHWKSRLGDKQQSAIINARPFHFTEALMMVPLRLKDPDYAYSLEEALVEETDTRASAKKNARVLRSFYVVSEVALNRQGAGGGARTLRRFWFDRTNGLLFTRQQLFDEKGSMSTEIRYSGYQKLSDENAHVWPTVVLVSRPYDNYAARLTFASGRFEVNPDDLSPNAFVLENTENLPVTDLDGPVTR
jgi:hypothetical protein